ncbi:Cytosolic carboxypeptidase 2, partial [Physocladia obscura]
MSLKHKYGKLVAQPTPPQISSHDRPPYSVILSSQQKSKDHSHQITDTNANSPQKTRLTNTAYANYNNNYTNTSNQKNLTEITFHGPQQLRHQQQQGNSHTTKSFHIYPVTYDPTRHASVNQSVQHQNPEASSVLSNHKDFHENNDQDGNDNDNSDSYKSDAESEFAEEKYMVMLKQYAEMSGIVFSAGFLADYNDDATTTTMPSYFLQEGADVSAVIDSAETLPAYKNRLPKDYIPNVVNPRPLMNSSDGPVFAKWPPFIKNVLEHPVLEKPGTPTTNKEAFYSDQNVQHQQQLPTTTTCAEKFGNIVFEAYYDLQKPQKFGTPKQQRQREDAFSEKKTPQSLATADSFNKSAPPQLVFESRFECGNLAKAIRCGSTCYELYVRNDLNTSGHTQWFYFRVQGMVARNESSYEDVVYRFDIVNLGKPKTLYNCGLRPLMYSKGLFAAKGIGWHRVGQNITYTPSKNILPSNTDDLQTQENQQQQEQKYTLSFTVNFPNYLNDTTYFAHCYPYSYTDLQTDISILKADPLRAPLFRHTVLAKTVAGNNIDLLTVTQPVTAPHELAQRKGIVLSARVHPGETNASWMMKGAIDFLTGDSKQAVELRRRFVVKIVPMLNPDGVVVGNYRCNLTGYDLNRQWRNAALRSSSSSAAAKAVPEVHAMLNLFERSAASREVVLFCDFHGHNRKNGIFMYGCENNNDYPNTTATAPKKQKSHRKVAAFSVDGGSVTIPKKTQSTSSTSLRRDENKNGLSPSPLLKSTPGAFAMTSNEDLKLSEHLLLATPKTVGDIAVTNDSNNNNCDSENACDIGRNNKNGGNQARTIAPIKFAERVFPLMLAQNLPDLFNFRRCQFKMQLSKQGTGRICVRTRFGIVNSFTIESSFCGTDDSCGSSAGWHFGTDDLERMGRGVGITLYDYFICEGMREGVYDTFLEAVFRGDG